MEAVLGPPDIFSGCRDRLENYSVTRYSATVCNDRGASIHPRFIPLTHSISKPSIEAM